MAITERTSKIVWGQCAARCCLCQVDVLHEDNGRVSSLVGENKSIVTSSDLREHPTLSVYLQEFGESGITLESIAKVAIDWWFAIVFDRDIPVHCLPVCMEITSRPLIMWRTISGVIATPQYGVHFSGVITNQLLPH